MAEIDFDELRRHWLAGEGVRALAIRFGRTKNAIASIIRRARRRDGLERWPHRPSPIKSARARPPHSGRTTLPPLASLE